MGPCWLRPYDDRDHPAVIELSRAVYNGRHESADEWRHAAMTLDGEQRRGSRYVALDPGTGAVTGYGGIETEPWLAHQGRCRLELLVHPERQGQGLGRTLSRKLLGDARRLEARAAVSKVLDNHSASLEFLARRGFAERERSWNLRLSVADANLEGLPEAVRRVESQEIALTTLAEERRRSAHCLPAFVDLWNTVAADQPGAEPYAAPPFDEFVRWLDHPNRPPDACLLARHGDCYVGLSMLQRRTVEGDWLTQNITGVRRKFRRRGIATALKLLAVGYARRAGYRVITTTNDSGNLGMLALNEALGFRRHAGWVVLEKPLA